MLRLFFRFIGLLVLGAAFAAMVVDATRSLAAKAPAMLPLGQTASVLFPSGFDKFKSFIQGHAPSLWDPAVSTILALPAWVVLGVVGLLLMAITRRPASKIGYSRR